MLLFSLDLSISRIVFVFLQICCFKWKSISNFLKAGGTCEDCTACGWLRIQNCACNEIHECEWHLLRTHSKFAFTQVVWRYKFILWRVNCSEVGDFFQWWSLLYIDGYLHKTMMKLGFAIWRACLSYIVCMLYIWNTIENYFYYFLLFTSGQFVTSNYFCLQFSWLCPVAKTSV